MQSPTNRQAPFSASPQRITSLAVALALATSLSLFESMIPAFPGGKVGLANIVSLYLLIAWGFRESMTVNLLRCLLASLVNGSFLGFGFLLSMFSGITSVIAMHFAYRLWGKHLSCIGISWVGAFTHNLSQLVLAAVLLRHPGIVLYLPYLMIFALMAGYVNGMIVTMLLIRLAPHKLPVKGRGE